MSKQTHGPSAQVELVPASREQEPILANLLELYIHDFSELIDLEIGQDGRFGYERLHLYWSEPDRHPFLVKVDGRLAGFVLVGRGRSVSGKEIIWDVTEFFVLRGYRRQGVGTRVVHEVWRRFAGRWEVRVMERNVAAQRFWARAIEKFTGAVIRPVRVRKDGEWWQVFSSEA